MNEEWLTGLEDYVADELPAGVFLPEDDEPDAHWPVSQVEPPWSSALVFDVALGVDDTSVLLQRHGLTPTDWERITSTPHFIRQVAEQARDLAETGLSFRAKAKVQAEMYLIETDRIVYSPHTDAKTKLEAIRSVVKWAELEPRPDKDERASAPMVNIQINM